MLALITSSATLVEETPTSDSNSLSKAFDVLVHNFDSYKKNSTISHVEKCFTILIAIGDEIALNMEELKVSTTENFEFLLEIILSFLAMIFFKHRNELDFADTKVVKSCVTFAEIGKHVKSDDITERAIYLLKLLIQVAKAKNNLDTLLPESSSIESTVLTLIS